MQFLNGVHSQINFKMRTFLFVIVKSGGRAVQRRTVNRGTVVQSHLPPFRNLALGLG